MSRRQLARRAAASLGEGIRATAIVIATTIVLLLLLEAAVRARRTLADRGRRAAPRAMLAGDPRAADWYVPYRREFEASRAMRWRPYVHFRLAPFAGRYITVDSLGRRRTPQPTAPATPIARVALFGGSTMWGEPQREEHTIAAELSRRLQALAGPGARVEVTNHGESGYVSTQGLVQLLLELRAGVRPDVVLFYDGLNDVGATVQRGVGGTPQNESQRIADFTLGRALGGREPVGLASDLRVVGTLAARALDRSALVHWARSRRPRPPAAFVEADSGARATVRAYVENVRLVEALAARYDFTAVYVWQPNLHASEKQLNAYEQLLRRQIAADPFHARMQDLHRRVPAMLDSALRDVAPGRTVNAAGLFAGDTMAVYVDRTGHTTEAATPRIVDAFWPALERAVRPVVEARRAGLSSAR